jgi:hypothetical protein
VSGVSVRGADTRRASLGCAPTPRHTTREAWMVAAQHAPPDPQSEQHPSQRKMVSAVRPARTLPALATGRAIRVTSICAEPASASGRLGRVRPGRSADEMSWRPGTCLTDGCRTRGLRIGHTMRSSGRSDPCGSGPCESWPPGRRDVASARGRQSVLMNIEKQALGALESQWRGRG